jgi:hypothetical protein
MIDTGTGDKVGPTLIIKPLTECSAGELIRLTSGAWAIVADDLKARRIFVISGDDAPVTLPCGRVVSKLRDQFQWRRYMRASGSTPMAVRIDPIES